MELPLPYMLTMEESRRIYNDNWLYRSRMPKAPKPENVLQAEADLDAAFREAGKYNALADDPSQRKRGPKTEAARKQWANAVKRKNELQSEWHRVVDVFAIQHRLAVEQAIAEGLDVPVRVLAEFSDLREMAFAK